MSAHVADANHVPRGAARAALTIYGRQARDPYLASVDDLATHVAVRAAVLELDPNETRDFADAIRSEAVRLSTVTS